MSDDPSVLADEYRRKALATVDVDHQALLLYIADGLQALANSSNLPPQSQMSCGKPASLIGSGSLRAVSGRMILRSSQLARLPLPTRGPAVRDLRVGAAKAQIGVTADLRSGGVFVPDRQRLLPAS